MKCQEVFWKYIVEHDYARFKIQFKIFFKDTFFGEFFSYDHSLLIIRVCRARSRSTDAAVIFSYVTFFQKLLLGLLDILTLFFSLMLGRMEELTNPEDVRINPKCDRKISLYGYLRGAHLKNKSQIHMPGNLTDF